MPLDNEHGRWVQRAEHVRVLLNQFLDNWPADGRILLRSTLQGAKAALSEHRQQAENEAPTTEVLRHAVAPFIESLQAFQRIAAVADSSELHDHVARVRDIANETLVRLSDESSRPMQTVDEVIDDFATEYRASLILALTANYALKQIVTTWYENQADDRDANHLDLRTMQCVAAPSSGTIPMSVLAASMTPEPVVITPQTVSAAVAALSGGTPPPIFRMAYTQWFATIIAAWEDTYRPRLAAAHGLGSDGNAWAKNDIQSDFFYELSQIRHDISHHAGICVESAGSTTVYWLDLESGARIAPTTPQMLDFLEHFPADELRRTPIRAPRTTERLPFQFDKAWTEEVAAYVAAIESVKKKRPTVIQNVIEAWMKATARGDAET